MAVPILFFPRQSLQLPYSPLLIKDSPLQKFSPNYDYRLGSNLCGAKLIIFDLLRKNYNVYFLARKYKITPPGKLTAS